MRIVVLVLVVGSAACGVGSHPPSNLPLRFVRDVAVPGPAVRFDYQDVDADDRRLYVAHLGAGDVVVVDLDRLEAVGTIPGVADVHGVRVAVVDLQSRRQLAVERVGSDPDVLAFDAGMGRLYVAAESGMVTAFAVDGQGVRRLGGGRLAAKAHTVAVDPRTHQVFFPLENVDGHPVLRVMQP